MKVWVLLMEDYSGKQQLVEVYSNKKKAEKAKERLLGSSSWIWAPVIKEKEVL